MLIKVKESEIRKMVAESVQRLLEFDEGLGGFGGGFDETARKRPAPPQRDPADKDGDGNTNNDSMQRKRSVVVDMFSNDNGKSDVKRRGAIELLYYTKDKGEWDTYRSEFSKYLDPDDTAHVWDDSQINQLYNWLSDVL